jgi:hypothetical protein
LSVILFKAVVSILIACAGAWAQRSRAFMQVAEAAFLRRVLALQLLPAMGLFLALYVFGGMEITSDVPGYYLPPAHAVLNGQLPYRDFPLSYAPLFPYMGGALLLVWNSGKVFALFAILVNALTLVMWHRSATPSGPATARTTTICYATSGLLLVQTLLGTNQVWVAAALSGSVLLQMGGREVGSGIVQSVCLCITKFLSLLFWPVLFICAGRRMRWGLAAVLLPLFVYGAVAVLGGNILDPVRREANLITSGNLPYLLDPLLQTEGLRRFPIFDLAAVLVLLSTLGWFFWRAQRLAPAQRRELLFAGLALVGLTFMLVSKKSFTAYTVFFMYPVILVLVRSGPKPLLLQGFLLLFNVVLAVEGNIWFRLGGDNLPLGRWLPNVAPQVATGFVVMDLLLVSSYLYLAYLAVASIRRAGSGMASSSLTQSSAALALL